MALTADVGGFLKTLSAHSGCPADSSTRRKIFSPEGAARELPKLDRSAARGTVTNTRKYQALKGRREGVPS